MSIQIENQKQRDTGNRGSILIVFTVALPVMLGFASLMVDVGYVYMVQHQMQTTADASALAGAIELTEDDAQAARAEAVSMAGKNQVGGESVQLSGSEDVEVGRWIDESLFINDHPMPNAVRVTVNRTQGSTQGPVDLFFGPVLGVDEVELTAQATARLAAVDMVLVLDTSSSMTHDTYYSYCTRWLGGGMCGCGYAPYGYQPIDTLRTAAISFVDDFDPDWDQIGLITYANSATKPQVLTDDFWRVEEEIVEIPIPNYCSGTRYTNIGHGIKRADWELSRSSRVRSGTEKIMVLLSDGRPTCTSDFYCRGKEWVREAGRAYARDRAERAANDGIVIHAISLGDGADRELMQYIAEVTGGEEFFAETGNELNDVFEQIRRRIPVQLTN